jgi:hypothetical protein
MSRIAFTKTLSANDVGSTGAHQAGVHIPKGERELLRFLPHLDPGVKNPDAWLFCVSENGVLRRFRFVYYNNRLHDEKGTRDEYRITYMTAWFREVGAKEGDVFEIARGPGDAHYSVRLVHPIAATKPVVSEVPAKVRLRGWQRVH